MLDTLTTYYVLPAADSVAQWGGRAVSADQIYGPISSFSGQVISQTSSWGEGLGVSLSWQSGVMLLILLLMFCYAIYRFGGLLRLSFKSLFSVTETISMFENSTLEFGYFIQYGRLLFLGVAAVACDGLFFDGVGDDFLNVLAVMGVLFVGSVMSSWLIGLLSVFDYNGNRWRELRSIRKIDRTISAYIFVLPIISFAYTSQMHVVLMMVLGIVLVVHFIRILLFFHMRGFSFLQSFLYLCAVEIAPFAFLWGVAVRLNSIHF